MFYQILKGFFYNPDNRTMLRLTLNGDLYRVSTSNPNHRRAFRRIKDRTQDYLLGNHESGIVDPLGAPRYVRRIS
jgi:hypothetical protein